MPTTNLTMHLKLINAYLVMNNIITPITNFLIENQNSLRVIARHISADHRNPVPVRHTRATEYGKEQERLRDCKKHVNLNFKHMVNTAATVHSEIAILEHPSIAFCAFTRIQKHGVHALRMDGRIEVYMVAIIN